MPNTLVRKGLASATEEFINSIAYTTKLQITFLHELAPPLLGKKSIHLYRILTEIIHNTIKHASAKRLDIHLFRRGEKLILATEDDGIGFDQQNVLRKKNGMGLQNMLNRSEMLGAEIFLVTHPGKGLHIIMEMPITDDLTRA
jgi:signal transduction histidine kinase